MPNKILGPDGRPIPPSGKTRPCRFLKPASIIASVGVLAGLVANFNTIYQTVKNWFPEKLAPDIEYVRFYGTFSVPYLLTDRETTEVEESPSRIFLIDFKETKEWWDSSNFKNMKIRLTPPLRQTQSAMKQFENDVKNLNTPLYRLLFAADQNARDCYLYLDQWVFDLRKKEVVLIENMLNSKGVESDRNSRIEYCKQMLTENSEKTGYLFLQISNTHEQPMRDVVINYKFWPMSNLAQEQWDTSDHIKPNKTSQSDLKDFTISKLDANSEHLLLLSIFLANSNRFPETFSSSTVLPVEISWKINGKEFSQEIRPPLLDQAVPVLVPIGWHKQ